MFVRLFLNSLANNVMYLGWLWMLWDERGQNPTPPGLLR